MIAFLFIAIIKVMGPVLFTYVWIEMATNHLNYQDTNERAIFALSLVAYFAPFGLMVIVLGFQRIVKLARKKTG